MTSHHATGRSHHRSLSGATEPDDPFQREDFLATVDGLLPLVRALGDRIEQDGRLPAELVRALTDAGLFRIAVPRAYGGTEADPLTVAAVVETLAAADASTAWCVMLAAQAATTAAFLPRTAAAEIFADARTIPAMVARPSGRAEAVEGGYVVKGRWPFASGSKHASWFGGECVVTKHGEPLRDDQGQEIIRLLFFPRTDVAVLDTWNTTGLRGTGSNDFSVSGSFVPARRSYRIHVDPPMIAWPLSRAAPLAFLSHGSHALGVARASIDTVASLAMARAGLRDQPRVQTQLAEAQAMTDAARQYLYGSAGELWTAASAGGQGTTRQRAAVRLATAHAMRSAVASVELMYRTAGTAAIPAGGPLDRQFRDIQTAAAHVMVSPATYEAAGRVALGLEPGMLHF
jgi:alkylation response protein AidB-like acyl-CoA dehydrogenase